jgi:hypothetical protein
MERCLKTKVPALQTQQHPNCRRLPHHPKMPIDQFLHPFLERRLEWLRIAMPESIPNIIMAMLFD